MKIKKILSMFLIGVTLLMNFNPVYASADVPDKVETVIFTHTVPESYTVTIPKNLVMDTLANGQPIKQFNISVLGDIGATTGIKIKVANNGSFFFTQTGKQDIEGEIGLESGSLIKLLNYRQIYDGYTIRCTAKVINTLPSAGVWTGNVNFHISKVVLESLEETEVT